MALESVVFQQDPFAGYGCKELYNYGLGFEEDNFGDTNPTSDYVDSSSPEVCVGEVGVVAGAYFPVEALEKTHEKRKRRKRSRSTKNEEEIESQRMTHITVERNRRKQMNEYLAYIRSLMPPSYALRGDQASIVAGAINFVKELEQLLQFLEAQKQTINSDHTPNLFANFFTFPQYSTCRKLQDMSHESTGGMPSTVADVEVSMVETHANIKILSRKQPKQLLKLVSGFYSLGFNIQHLNVSTADHMALYSFSVKLWKKEQFHERSISQVRDKSEQAENKLSSLISVEDEARLGTVNKVANTIHEMIQKIQEGPISN